MRWLIDGYNVMHAGGRVARGTNPERFQRARRRFLDELADALGPEIAEETTVVFDANSRPNDFPLESTFRGLRVIFALGDENADARIEAIIAKHATPKTLTTVSTDRRVRQAASRRRCHAMTADAYWNMIDDRKERNRIAKSKAKPIDRSAAPATDESRFWEQEFAELDESPAIQQLRRSVKAAKDHTEPTWPTSMDEPRQNPMADDRQKPDHPVKRPTKVTKRSAPPVDEEAQFWQKAFADLEESPEIQQLGSRDETLLTDDEIARIEREIARELPGQKPKYLRKRGHP